MPILSSKRLTMKENWGTEYKVIQRNLVRFLRSAFISFETVSILGILFCGDTFPKPFEWIGGLVIHSHGLIGLFIKLFGALIGISIYTCRKILFPSVTKHKLDGWHKYLEFRITCQVGLLWLVIGAFLSIIPITCSSSFSCFTIGLMLTMGLAVSGISFFSLLGASYVIQSILSGYEEEA